MKTKTKFKDFLTESKVTIYHGGNTPFTKIEPKYMMTDKGNAQEGIGIYFSNDFDVADSYGKIVIQAEVNDKDFIESRDPFKKLSGGFEMLKYLRKKYEEDFYYLITDYVEVYEPEDVNDYHIKEMYRMMSNEDIRNITIELSQAINPIAVAEAWRKHVKYIGMKYSKLGYYIVIKDIKLKRIQ